MSNITVAERASLYCRGQVVYLSDTLLALQLGSGETIPADELGPGTVEEIGLPTKEGEEVVLVRWHRPDLICWMETRDLTSPGRSARLIEVARSNLKGQFIAPEYKVVTTAGLHYNWRVEILPDDVVRTLRSDGWVWTFEWNEILEKVFPLRTRGFDPPTDEYAEAETVAELETK